MQFRKSFALLAAALVGFGASSAGAQAITSVTIAKPDSGSLLGIDSTFVVTAVVQDVSHDATDAVLLFLVAADSTVIDGYASNTPSIGSSGMLQGATKVAATTSGSSVPSTPTGQAAVVILQGSSGATVGSAAASADSVKVSSDKTTYTWYGKVTSDFGTKGGIRAAAYAFDASHGSGVTGVSSLVVSPASKTFQVDGDRPPTPVAITTSATSIGRAKKNAPRVFTFTGGSLSAATNKAVHGIGDTIAFKVKLGSTAGNAVFTPSNKYTVVADLFGKAFNVPVVSGTQDTIAFRRTIAAGDFGNLAGAFNANTDTISVFVVDAAGNRSAVSGANNATEEGVTKAVSFFVDATAPTLDGGVADGDTILPVSNDTITDGAINTGFLSDLNPMKYRLGEALDSLLITFDGSTDLTLKVTNETGTGSLGSASSIGSSADAALAKAPTTWVQVNFSNAHSAKVGNTFATVTDPAGSSPTTQSQSANNVTGKITSGVQSVTFTGVDLAGNKGPVLTRTNVYVDVDDLEFKRLFPTAASALDTIDEETSKVVFQLSEDADSVLITYTPITGNGTSTRKLALVGSQLTSDLEQTFTVDSLVTGTVYQLQLLGADLAGNYAQTAPDTFVYDTTYVVPVIASFAITNSAINPLSGSTGTKYRPAAGDTLTLTLQAKTISDANAVTYKQDAVLKVTNASGTIITGTGLSPVTGIPGRFTLTADDWITGARTVKLIDTTAIDTSITADHISVTVIDSSDTTNIYSGVIDTTIRTSPAALNKIGLAAADTVGQGDAFLVAVSLADKFGNTRTTDGGFIEVTTTVLGVQLPVNAIPVTKGVGEFWANSNGYSGDLTITARGITGQASGKEGTVSVYVDGDGATVLDDPDTLIAQDYKGASGNGDQGGFVLLTFPVSDDHATLSKYRIYRELSVDYAADGNGGLVALAEPTTEMVSWGTVDPVPGASVMRVVVATLDGDSTSYGVAAERGGLSSKEAFESADAVSTPYELMAETMLQSKEAAQLDPGAPVFATLTPEAMAFDANGVVPRLKTVDDVLRSSIRSTVAPVRAIDDIAPAPIASLLAQDTEGDVGGSITLRWAPSADDRMLTTTVPNAIGDTKTYTTAGVAGYNIYRHIGDAAWQMVGQVGAGVTSFEDATVFNGVRYGYKVEARDADNVTDSGLERSAMAIRNKVYDVSGQPVIGLFGADNKVDVDDFFIFADHFGMAAGIDGFDKAFDLDPNNAIDIADFFVFADNFGREAVGAGKAVPTMAGLNSDARFYLDAGSALPRVGEELSVAVNLEDYVEVRGYGLTVEFDNQLLEFVGPQVVDNALGETELASPRTLSNEDGKVSIAAFGNTVSEGDVSLNLVFRAKQEIESSYIELTSGALQDGSYGLNRMTSPVSIRVETRPEVYALADNYPNPFNPETTIKYQLPEAGQVTLEVYNMLGQVVKTLVNNQFQNAGRYTLQWDATNNSGQALSSGVYFYRITAGGEFQSHKKMLLLK